MSWHVWSKGENWTDEGRKKRQQTSREYQWENTLQLTSCVLSQRTCVRSTHIMWGWHQLMMMMKKPDNKAKRAQQIQKLIIQNDITLKDYSFQGTSITLWTAGWWVIFFFYYFTSRIFLTLISQASSSWCAQFNGWHIYSIIWLSDTHLDAIYYLKHTAANVFNDFTLGCSGLAIKWGMVWIVLQCPNWKSLTGHLTLCLEKCYNHVMENEKKRYWSCQFAPNLTRSEPFDLFT